MARLLVIGVFLITALSSRSQIVNNGASIVINQGGVLYFGDDYLHKGGVVLNNGVLTILKNIENHSNNNVFYALSSGEVRLVGTSKFAGGSNTILFPSLVLDMEGTLSLTGNIEINQLLNLSNASIVTGTYYIGLNNPETNSLLFDKGFVNTAGGGALRRRTNSSSPYFFPFGVSNFSNLIAATPSDGGSNTFAATFFQKDPSQDGYSRLSKRQDLNMVSDQYYYQIAQPVGASKSVISFYNKKSEGDFNWTASWVENRIWEKMPEVKITEGSQFSGKFDRIFNSSLLNPIGAIPVPYTLANTADVNNPLVIFNAFSPDGDNKNDKWVVKNIDAYPDNDVSIFDRSGNLVFRSVGYTEQKAWDGQNAINGTYFYVIRVKINGEQKYFKGAITLVKQ